MNYILVLDDSPELLESFQMILSMNGYECKTILTEQELMNEITIRRPDLILLDIHLDGKDGRELCKKIKQEPAHSSIRIVLTSGHSNKLKTYRDCLADGILEKPFSLKDLLATINNSMAET